MPSSTRPPDAAGPIRVLGAAAVDAALAYPALIEALRTAFREGGEVPVRHHHSVPRPGKPDTVLLLMPAWQPGAATGVKLVTISPGNEAAGLPSVQGIYVLLDGPTGAPLAILDGTALTLRRTAAASALAASFLARSDAARHLMVGAGALAPHLVRAHRTVRPLRSVTVWNRTPERAERLVADLRTDGIEADVAPDLADAVSRADVISVATMSQTPLIRGDWLAPGTHLDLVGAYTPRMRESDDRCMERAEVFVDTRSGALAEAGDIVQPIESGVLDAADIRADLFDLCGARHPGRTDARQITLFKSVGTAIEDLAAARLVVARTAAEEA